jgi:hypothetical protein
MKNFRTDLANLTSAWGTIMPKEMTDAQISRIYGGLTEDLNTAALRAGGPDGLQAHNLATNTYKAVQANRERLVQVLGGDKATASPEAVYGKIMQLAGSTNAADIGLLRDVKAALPPNDWDRISQATMGQLGYNPTTDSFSPAKFLTGYGKLSDAAKEELFAPGSMTRQNLDDIQAISNQWKSVWRYANPSGTGHVASALAVIEGAVHRPISTVAALIGGRAMGNFLASPAGSGAMSNWMRANMANSLRPSPATQDAIRHAAVRVSAIASAQLGAKIDPMGLAALAYEHRPWGGEEEAGQGLSTPGMPTP